MSFILDALRKSESERQRDAAPTLTRAAMASPRRATSAWSWLVIVVLTVALIALGVSVWLDREPGALTPAALPEPEPTRTAPTPVAPSPDAPAPAATQAAPLTDAPDAPPRPLSELLARNPGLPEFELAFVAYDSADPSQSSAWINGRRHFPGDTIGNGVTLAEITPNSVILAWQGQRFLLRL